MAKDQNSNLSQSLSWDEFVAKLRKDFSITDSGLGPFLTRTLSQYRRDSLSQKKAISAKRYRRKAKAIAAHLQKAIKQLSDIADWDAFQRALRAGRSKSLSTTEFLDLMERIITTMQSAGEGRVGKGPASKTVALYDLVSSLADYWLEHGSKRLTQGTKGTFPKTGGFAHFVDLVVRYCEPSQNASVPKVVERYMANWRKSRNFLY